MRLMPHRERDAGLNQPPVLSKRDLLGSQQVHVLNVQSALSHTEQGGFYILAWTKHQAVEPESFILFLFLCDKLSGLQNILGGFQLQKKI